MPSSKGEVVDFVLSAQQKGGASKASAIGNAAKNVRETWKKAELALMSLDSLVRLENKEKKYPAGKQGEEIQGRLH